MILPGNGNNPPAGTTAEKYKGDAKKPEQQSHKGIVLKKREKTRTQEQRGKEEFGFCPGSMAVESSAGAFGFTG
jgi:hypothetical protein